MSCVALLKAMRKKQNSVPCSHQEVLSVKAMPANDEPKSTCVSNTHQRLVL